MSVSFSSFEIARSGLYVNERGLFVTGHNISNVNTPGYSRQQALITTGQYQNELKYQLGLGADVQKIRQIRHTFLDNVYRQENESLGYWETRQKTFQDVQSILGEPMGEGLQNVMNQFWDSWQELSKNPESLTVRALVRQRGGALVQYMNHTGEQVSKLQSDLDLEIKVRVDEMNSIMEKVSKLNVEILRVENAGDTANDYRDQRNSLIDRLSKLVDCQVNEMQDGQVDITIGGYFLVNKGNFEKLTTVENKTGSIFAAPALQKGEILLPIKNGILKGLMEARGEVIGAKGSVENGSACDKIDLVFAFNTDDSSTDKTTDITDTIEQTVKKYVDKGIGVRLAYLAFNSSGVGSPVFVDTTPNSSGVYMPNVQDFIDGVSTLAAPGSSTEAGGLGALNVMLDAVKAEETSTDWRNTARQFVLVSETSTMDTAGISVVTRKLHSENVNTLLIASDGGDSDYRSTMNILSEAPGNRWVDSATSTVDDISEAVSEGVRNSIYGSLETTKNIIPDVLERLNKITNALAREVNRLHKSGKTLDGRDGMDFFVPIDPDYPMEMGNIQLNPKLSDLNNIVTSAEGSSGDNTVAVGIAGIRHAAMMGNMGQVQSMDDFYRSVITDVGNGGSEAEKIGETQRQLVNSVNNNRLAIMNVSMDEEVSNMMKYQYAYQGAAKVLNIIDEMFDSVINRLGIVGR